MKSKRHKYDFNQNKDLEMSSRATKRKETREPVQNTLLTAVVEIYYEYCSNTSIHGVQYLGERRPVAEKIFWLAVFVVSIFCCSNLIGSIYNKWNETPVIVSFSEKSTPVWNIPFPAVTICSETKRAFNTTGTSFADFFDYITSDLVEKQFVPKNITDSELEELRTLLQICNTQTIDEDLPLLSTKPIDHSDILDRMLPEFKRYFWKCKWLSHAGDCDKLLTKTYTDEGICFTFNGLQIKDIYREDTYQYRRIGLLKSMQSTYISNRTLQWSLDSGYTAGGIKTYPARVLGAGSRAGFFIALQSFKQELDYACRGPIQGFKVLLHSPDDVPHVSKEFVRIPMGREVLIAVKPNMITTSKGIAEYDPMRRQCFLNGERNLRFFKSYTQNNCNLECLTNFTLSKCGCVKFSMPRSMGTPVCAEDKIHCYDSAEDDVLLHEFNQALKDSTFNHRGETECNCLPACTSLVYNTEISQGNFDLMEMLESAGDTEFLENYPGSQMSRLSIYFKENQFLTSRRSELYGVTDFLANCGGIFGLFMGFSILSMVEMIYHFTLRLWSNMKRIVIV